MNKLMKTVLTACSFLLLIILFSGCKNDDSSVVKIFVRSASNELLEGAQVVIVGDVNSTPATMSYVDTVFTNSSGFAVFNMDTFFSNAGEDNSTGYFDIIVKKNGAQGAEYIRARAHITTVETVFLN
jgi:hypothetical protein